MTAADMALLAQSLAPAVQQVVTKALGPLQERLAVMEAKQAAVKDLDFDLIARLAAGLVPAPKDGANGKDADEAAVLAMRSDLEALKDDLASVKALPAPVVPDVATLVAEAMQEAVEAWRPTVGPIVAEHVREAVGALPAPHDGVHGKDGTPGERGTDGRGIAGVHLREDGHLIVTLSDDTKVALGVVVGRPGERGEKGDPGQDGQDGIGLAGALLTKDGTLAVTLSDGTVRELGQVIGNDGEPGVRGADGQDGKDGRDGLGIDDFDVIQDHERQFRLRWTNGDRVVEKTFQVPVTIYRGIWQRDKAYEAGDQVTYGGAQWIAFAAAPAGCQPETVEGAAAWKLSAKRGDKGAPGVPGKKGDPGPPGKDGVDPWRQP